MSESATRNPSAEDPELVHYLDGQKVIRDSHMPTFMDGSFGDVFLATHDIHGRVAMKRPRMTTAGISQVQLQQFRREADMWKALDHNNILKFLETVEGNGVFWLVSLYASNGSLPSYLKAHPEADRRRLVIQLMDALGYLHSQRIVHGDLKGGNVLVSHDVRILVCDFGLSKHVEMATASSLKGWGTSRWKAPELFQGKSKTFESDVFAFAMTLYEILSGNIPFFDHRSELTIMKAIERGDRPPRDPAASSTGVSYDDLWEVAEECWDDEHSQRPAILAVRARFGSESKDPMVNMTPQTRQEMDTRQHHLYVRGKEIELQHTPIASGGFGEVFVGEHDTYGTVAVKRSRDRLDSDPAALELMRVEARVWRDLRHRHVLSFIAMIERGTAIYLVSPFAPNGNLREHVQRNPEAPRKPLVLQLASAVAYIHLNGIVHGDIKSSNGLVSKTGEVLLCDFGLSKSVRAGMATEDSLRGSGSMRWMARELLEGDPEDDENARKTFASDVYAYGMTVYEILTGRFPFQDQPNEIALIMRVLRGDRPDTEPMSSSSGESYKDLWPVVVRCWDDDAFNRPSMESICRRFRYPLTPLFDD